VVYDLEITPNRPDLNSVIGIARGTGGGRSLLLNGHIDTVGVTGMSRPHQPRTENGRLYGRGAYDMKAGVAACMLATAELKKRGPRGDVIITAVADDRITGIRRVFFEN
jgi:acetylornithine deacetylase